eukprot:401212-Hanusia_phi.AAC.1
MGEGRGGEKESGTVGRGEGRGEEGDRDEGQGGRREGTGDRGQGTTRDREMMAEWKMGRGGKKARWR